MIFIFLLYYFLVHSSCFNVVCFFCQHCCCFFCSVGTLSNFWTKVVVENLSAQELTEVLSGCFPEIAPFINTFLETFHALQKRNVSSDEAVNASSLTQLAPGRYLSARYVLLPIYTSAHAYTNTHMGTYHNAHTTYARAHADIHAGTRAHARKRAHIPIYAHTLWTLIFSASLAICSSGASGPFMSAAARPPLARFCPRRRARAFSWKLLIASAE